jgi:hypothetical protein
LLMIAVPYSAAVDDCCWLNWKLQYNNSAYRARGD